MYLMYLIPKISYHLKIGAICKHRLYDPKGKSLGFSFTTKILTPFREEHPMKRCQGATICLLVLVGLLFCLPEASIAAQPPLLTEQTKPEADAGAADADQLRDPAALAELKRATDFLAALPRFHIHASVAYDVIQEDGRRLQFEKDGDIYLQRPNRLFADVHLDDGRRRQFWYDGATLSIAERSKNIHTLVKAPPTIDGMLDMLEGLFKEPFPLSDLLYSDLRPLEQRALEADIVGESLVKGRKCLHLAFRGETVDWQIWVDQGATPFIRKLAITYRQEPGTPQFVASLSVWETPKRFKEGLFKFVVPAGSQAIGVLVPPRRME
jgi:hypothetical protein